MTAPTEQTPTERTKQASQAAYSIGLDLGGGGVRCLLLDLESGEFTCTRRPVALRPAPGSGGLGWDLDPAAIVKNLAAAIREALALRGAAPEQVCGIATTAMRLGTVLIDAAGTPLFAVPNRDARAFGPGLTLAAKHGDELLQLTGRWPSPIFAAARLRWLRETQPALLDRSVHYLSISDWMTWLLCGRAVAEPSQAGESLLFDLADRSWAWEWIDRLELPRAIFPQLALSGERVGSVTAEAAALFGLAPGTPVAAGGADTQCALLGANVTQPGSLAVVGGSTAPVQRVLDAPLVDAEGRVWTGCHVLPGRFVLESNAGPAGTSLEWLGRVFFPDAPPHVGGTAMLLADAALSEPGSLGLLSTLGAERMDARHQAVPVGHLTLSHMATERDPAPRRHVSRSVVEGIACGLRANIEQLAAIAGAHTGAVRFTGGLSESGVVAQILADVLGAPVEASAARESTALGAALCAAVGAAVQPDLECAAAALIRPPTLFAPKPETADTHADLYARWTRLGRERSAADALSAQMLTPYAIRACAVEARAPGLAPRPRVLITSDFDPASLAALSEIADVEYASFRDKRRMLTGPSLVLALQGFDAFVTEIDLVDSKALAALPDLRVIASCRGDAVNVDIAACTAFGIPMFRTPGRNADAVADLTLAFLLMLARKLPEASRFLSGKDIAAGDMAKLGLAFGKFRGRELWRKTVGLIGLGAVGTKVCERLRGFGVRILVADPFVSSERAAALGASKVELETLLRESDFVSLHAAVTRETTGMLAAAQFNAMKPGACLVNTARAALLDEADLIAALERGTLGGAALDTFAVEPPGHDHPLLALPNVIATPHLGGNTQDVAEHQGEIIVAELERLLTGERPRFVVNPEVLSDFRWSGPRRQPSAAELAKLAEGPAPAVSDLQKQAKRSENPANPGERPSGAQAPTPQASPTPVGEAGAGARAAAPGLLPEATAARMREITRAFVEEIVRDEVLRSFSVGRDVTLHFHLEDADASFYFTLADGAVRGAVGAPEATADVALRLRADVLDGMFTGRANAMEAAMEGRLSFTGDAAKAMTLQHLQSDLMRLYQAARARVGAPGDLTVSASAQATLPLAPGDIREELVAIVRELYEGQVITATGGNVSVRIPGEDAVWITPSQLFKGDLRPEVLVRIDLAGRALDAGSRSPSSEWDMHCAVLKAKPEARAVIHAHAPHATILANTGIPFLPISTEAAFFGDIPRVPFTLPGTPELATAVGEAIGDGWAVLMINHGIVVAGRSLRRAADMVEIIERTAEIILGCHAVGKEPPVLPPEVVKQLRALGDLVA